MGLAILPFFAGKKKKLLFDAMTTLYFLNITGGKSKFHITIFSCQAFVVEE